MRKWNKKTIQEVALDYNTKGDFAIHQKSAYNAAKIIGIFEDVTSHMIEYNYNGIPKRERWTVAVVQKIVDNCTNRSEFWRDHQSAALAATEFGFYVEVTKNLPFRDSQNGGGFNSSIPGMFYYLRDNLTGLYKIGITNRSLSERFPTTKYDYKILIEDWYQNGLSARHREDTIKGKYNKFRTLNETWRSGRTEFFTMDILNADGDTK